MATIMQKAVHGYDVEQYLGRGADLVAGFVLPAPQVAGLVPAHLHAVHGLGFPGAPFPQAPDHVDVLRFAAPAPDFLHTAAEPEVRDRPPYTGTGFATWPGGSPVPVYLLDAVRVPAGAELWRIGSNGGETLLGVYPDAATGWLPVGWDGPRSEEKKLIPQDVLGTVAVWDFSPYIADLVDDGSAVVLCAVEQPDGEEPQDGDLDPDEYWEPWAKTPRGLWRKKVDIAEVTDMFEGLWTCLYRGVRCRITSYGRDEQGQEIFKLHYIGHDAAFAEAMEFNKSDAGVYWASVARNEVSDLRETQLRPAQFAS